MDPWYDIKDWSKTSFGGLWARKGFQDIVYCIISYFAVLDNFYTNLRCLENSRIIVLRVKQVGMVGQLGENHESNEESNADRVDAKEKLT